MFVWVYSSLSLSLKSNVKNKLNLISLSEIGNKFNHKIELIKINYILYYYTATRVYLLSKCNIIIQFGGRGGRERVKNSIINCEQIYLL